MTSIYCRAVALAALLLAGACTTSDTFSAQVTRFHLNQPQARGTIFIEPLAGPADSLEFQTYAGAIGAELRRVGFEPVPTRDAAEQLAVVGLGQTVREGIEGDSPVRIGIGGGTGGSSGGIGIGTSFGVGSGRSNDVTTNTLSIKIERKSDRSVIWEGRAASDAKGDSPNAAPGTAVPQLARALFDGFPGESGKTVRYPPKK